jgi:hypothetical protein
MSGQIKQGCDYLLGVVKKLEYLKLNEALYTIHKTVEIVDKYFESETSIENSLETLRECNEEYALLNNEATGGNDRKRLQENISCNLTFGDSIRLLNDDKSLAQGLLELLLTPALMYICLKINARDLVKMATGRAIHQTAALLNKLYGHNSIHNCMWTLATKELGISGASKLKRHFQSSFYRSESSDADIPKGRPLSGSQIVSPRPISRPAGKNITRAEYDTMETKSTDETEFEDSNSDFDSGCDLISPSFASSSLGLCFDPSGHVTPSHRTSPPAPRAIPRHPRNSFFNTRRKGRYWPEEG